MMNANLLGTAYPIYFVGESHCIVFGNTLFQAEPSKEIFLSKVRFLQNLKAEVFLTENGQINPRIYEALVAEGLIDEGMPKHLIDTHHSSSVAFCTGMPVMPPPIVLFGGDMSLHDFFREFTAYDFILPDDTLYGVDKNKELVPFNLVQKKIAGIFKNFLQCAVMLRNAGFNRLMIHCLPPRATNKPSTARFNIDCAIRAKLTIVANQILKTFCEQENMGYIDTWPETTKEGYQLEGLDLDGVHLTKAAVNASLSQIMKYLFSPTSAIYNHARYNIAYKRSAENFNRTASEQEQQWQAAGFIVEKFASHLVAPLVNDLNFDMTKNALARMDWTYDNRKQHDAVLLAAPTAAHLHAVENLLGNGMGYALLHCGAANKLTISSYKPLRLKSSIDTLTSAVPPGVRKMLLHIAGAGSLQMKSLTGEVLKEIALEPGTMVIYDPNRTSYSFLQSGTETDIIEMTAIPQIPGHPFRVVWAGFNDLPVDPFSYSTVGMLAAPPFKHDRVHEKAHP